MTKDTDAFLYNPFVHAPNILERFRTHRKFVVSDFDKTQTTGDPKPGKQELSDRAAVVQQVADAGAVLACITARTPALAMSQESYLASVRHGYTEPPPRWRKDSAGIYLEVDPATEPFFKHNVDWPIIGSFGRGILVKNGSGYRVDKGYEQLLDADILNPDSSVRSERPRSDDMWAPVRESETPSPWRVAMMAFVFDKLQFAFENLAPIEISQNYVDGKTNVGPLPYRVQFNFSGPEGYRKMLEVKRTLEKEKHANNLFALRIFTVDESRIHPTDPAASDYVLYLVPWFGRKENMFNRMLSKMVEASGILPPGVHPGEEPVKDAYESIKLFYAGDSPTDLKIGLNGGGRVKTHFLLPTSSDLAASLMGRRNGYGVVNLSFLWEDPLRKRQNPRLVPTGRTGEYHFVHKVQKMLGHTPNLVVIGDERYPNRTPPGSVAEFLSEYL